ncbi:MAG: hypothetical protein MUC95_10050 [Spirochaetes bacterium]|nr:hypothetical protein [Spirochaetota bacterium]
MINISGAFSAEQKEFSLIEEDELFWSRLLSDPAVDNRNELYAAYVAYTERIFDLAIETFNSSIRHNLSNESIKSISSYYIGKILVVLGKYGEAILKFNSAAERDLGKYSYIKSAILINAAIAHYRQKDITKVKALLSEVIANPSDVKYKRIALSMFPAEEKHTLEQASREDTRMPEVVKKKNKEFHKTSKYMGLGINLGEIFMLGKWGDKYNNTVYLNPYFLYFFSDNAGISLNIDYFFSEVKSKHEIMYSSLVLLAGTAGIIFNLKFTESIGLSFSIGAGAARTYITVPGTNITGNRDDYVSETYDPYVNTALSFGYNINNLQISTGVSSKRVYYYSFKKWKYENNDLDMIGVFLGMSIKT